jgi:serine/threonine protein kinase
VTQAEEWRVFSAQLDHALEMEGEQRELWLDALEKQDSALAARVRGALLVEQRPGYDEFLSESPPLPVPEVSASTLIGRSVGAYVIDAEIGRGGMGSVWRAHRADGRYTGEVAVKFVHASWVGQLGGDQFRTEGTLLGRLNHPNIARLLDAGMLDATQPYLVLEYVEGEPIDVYCERHALNAEARLRLFLEVLEAVAHAHNHLIVHRDLKPSNVLVTQDGVVKLLDFGIAKLLDEHTGAGEITVAGTSALTPQYAAPEQLLGQPVTTATDVYALGNLLYTLLTGRHAVPLATGSKAEIVKAIVTQEPLLASSVGSVAYISRRTLAGDLDNILHKALKKMPTERYASAAALAEDLRRYLADQPIQARADTVGYRTSKFVRRHRGGVAAAMICILAIICGLIGTLWQAQRANAAAIQAERQRERALQQLNYARAASDFLSFLLQQGSNRPFTTPELLTRGEQLIRGQFSEDPAMRARLLLTLANLYGQVGQQEKSLQLHSTAQTLAHQSSERSLQLQADCALAHEFGDQRLFEKAFPALDAAIAGAQADPDIEQAVLGECLIQRSEVHLDHGDILPALADAQGALDLLGKERDVPKTLLLAARITVADAKASLGDDATAVREYRQAIDLVTGMGRGQTDYAATFYTQLGRYLSRSGQWLDAASAYERSIQISREVAAGEPINPVLLTNYAKLLVDLGRSGEAIPLFDEALLASTRIGNFKGVAMANLMSAPAYCAVGKLSECAARLSLARTALMTQLTAGNTTFGTLETEDAQRIWDGSDASGPRDHLQEALKIFGAASDHNPNAMRALALLTEVDLKQGDIGAAREHAAQLLTAAKEALHGFQNSAWLGRAQLVQAEVLLSLGKFADARASLGEAVTGLRSTVGASAPWTLQAEGLLKQ